MNKNELIRAIANKMGVTLPVASDALNSVIDAITDSLMAGEKVQISGFGAFEIKEKPAREGVNPQNGQKISLGETKTPVFKFGKAYKDSFNK